MDLSKPFTYEDKFKSFLELQIFLENIKEGPFFIGRLSGNEPNLCGKVLNKENIPESLILEMLNTAGIYFKSNDDIKEYVKQYIQSCKNCDILGVWSSGMYYQGKALYEFIKKVNTKQKDICAQALEPYYYMKETEYKFHEFFKSKKILIISSHENSINQQINKNIYEKTIFDKSCEINVYKPHQQNGGNFDGRSWIIHYEEMKNEIKSLENEFNFDIAFVSCGGFGMPICNFIYKEMNKSVIYIGGALQLYFGIMGNRWRTNPNILQLKNDNWIDVLDSDIPEKIKQNKQLCENQCYW